MQNNQFLLINNIIYKIYSIEDFEDMEKIFLASLKMLIHNTFSSILMADNSSDKHLLCNPVCMPEDMADIENTYLTIQDKDYARWSMMSGQSVIMRETDLMNEEERTETLLYKKCYKPYGLHYSIQLNLIYNSTFLGVVTLYRKKSEGDFTDNEIFILKSFIDHLCYRFSKHSDNINKKISTAQIDSLAFKYKLTNREVEVLALILDGIDNKEIADKLCISIYTLKKHIQNLYRKMNVTTKWELLKYNNL